MDVNKIEEIYRDSYQYQKYNNLYNYFSCYCGFKILSKKLGLGFDTVRIRDFEDLKGN